jgi:hypothetical protein
MAGIVDRLGILLEERKERLPSARARANDSERDSNGGFSRSLASHLRFIGIAEYVLNHDIAGFKSNFEEAARISNQLFVRYDAGEPIAPSLVSMIRYQELFCALAAGALELTRGFAGRMGGREKIEKEFDHPFDRTLGYTLKSFALEDRGKMELWSGKFTERCERKTNANDRGYALMFESILESDESKANESLIAIIEGHRRLSKRGRYKDMVDETLCVWGIGIVNLARIHGLNVSSEAPLIPADLLI